VLSFGRTLAGPLLRRLAVPSFRPAAFVRRAAVRTRRGVVGRRWRRTHLTAGVGLVAGRLLLGLWGARLIWSATASARAWSRRRRVRTGALIRPARIRRVSRPWRPLARALAVGRRDRDRALRRGHDARRRRGRRSALGAEPLRAQGRREVARRARRHHGSVLDGRRRGHGRTIGAHDAGRRGLDL